LSPIQEALTIYVLAKHILLPLVHQSSAAFVKAFPLISTFLGGLHSLFMDLFTLTEAKIVSIIMIKSKKGWNQRNQLIMLCFIPGLPQTFNVQSIDLPA
jgi:hypothetical protein